MIAPNAFIQAAVDDESLIAIGHLSPTAAKRHTPFEQPQHWTGCVDAEVKGPSLLLSLRHAEHPLDMLRPVLAEPTIGMQHHEPVVLSELQTQFELLSSTPHGALHKLGASLMGHPDGVVDTASIYNNDLEGIWPPLEICQEEGEVPSFIEGGNHNA